ncbi:SBBP repeat-containing protein [Leptospira kanakyensis]|uniref:SBBP repeat-containing protein n=1 Tax=Leptospira kanakyensis TaxID=2484968 RepID=UPI00223E64F5|nr:SBBP repeat-containing protein [Leptospira kanakyensis]MCW7480579.1 SBBP repeat-containing protein [Leptospira kanakyensis]
MKFLNLPLVLFFTTNCIFTPLFNFNTNPGSIVNDILLVLGASNNSAGTPEAHDSVPIGEGEVTIKGGTLRSNDGMITIDIPEGAVAETVEFKISKFTLVTNSYPGSYLPTSSAYEILPSYRFKKPVTVSMSLNTATIQSLNLSKTKSLGFSYSTTSVTDNSGRFPSWLAHDTTIVGDKVVFNTETFSIFGIGTPPPGNQPPINLGASYYFKAGCSYLPYMLRTRVIDPDGDPIQVYLITGPGNGGAVAIPMAREGVTDWYTANIPYEAMSESGIQIQISASDSYGQTSFVPSSGIFNYPNSSNNALYISNFELDQDNDGLLCAWERDNGKSDTNAGDAGGVVDSDGDGIPNVADHTPNGEANPPIDFLQIMPTTVSLDLTDKVIFGVTARFGGSPRYVNASYMTTGIGLNGNAVGTMNSSTFLPSVPGTAGVVATVGAMNSTATVNVLDTVGPNDISTLSAMPISSNKIQLQWLAPGDDSQYGRATTYQIFRSTSSITNDGNCNGVLVSHSLIPKNAGVSEKLDVGGLNPNTTYFFCIRAVDDNGNFNRWNGTVFATTYPNPDLIPPSDIASVTAITLDTDKILLSWNAVGDDGNSGSAQNYEIYRSTTPLLTDTQCRSAVLIPNTVPTSPAGTALNFTATNLADNTIYYFCIVAVDESNNYSTWNGITTATTLRKNLPPTISLVDTISGILPNTISLDASLSGDPDAAACGANPANYVYSWSLLNKPPTSVLTTSNISNGNTKLASITPDVAGEYTIQFSFTDDKGSCGGTNLVNVKSTVITMTLLAGVKLWSKQLGVTSALTLAQSIKSDSNGFLYVTGSTGGHLDGQTKTGGNDLFLMKYNSNGIKQWTKLFGVASANTDAMGITLDSNGNIYITGVTTGNLDGITKLGPTDLFVVKYNADGVRQWTRLLGAPGTTTATSAYGITSDGSGNIYVSGHTYGNLDGQSVSGQADMFIVKYDTNGTKQWTRLLSGGAGTFSQARGITSDSNGNIYATGFTNGALDGQTKMGARDLFVVRYNSSGVRQWTKQLGVASQDTAASSITTDSFGNLYVTGNTYGNLDGQTKTGSSDLFLIKYDSNGAKQWTKLLGVANKLTAGSGITLDMDGNIFITGPTEGNLDGKTITGIRDLFLVKYDSNGMKLWTSLLGAPGRTTHPNSVTSDLNGKVIVAGGSTGNMDGHILSGTYDMILVKYE